MRIMISLTFFFKWWSVWRKQWWIPILSTGRLPWLAPLQSTQHSSWRCSSSTSIGNRISIGYRTLHGDHHHQPIKLFMVIIITNPPPSFLLAETHIFIENSWADFFPARSPAYFLPGFQIALSHVHCSSRLDKSHVSDMVLSVWRRNVQLHLVSCPTYSAISHFIEIISFKSSSTNIEESHVRGPRIVKILDICIKFLWLLCHLQTRWHWKSITA